jgi:Zn-dependent metalloprotease
MKTSRSVLVLVLSASTMFQFGFSTSAKVQDISPKRGRQHQQQDKQQSQPSPDVLGYWQALQARSKEAHVVGWNKRSGTPSSIFGSLTTPLPGASEMSARAFLQANAPLFKLETDTSGLRLANSSESVLGRHFIFKQYYGDIPVYGSAIGIHFNGQGEIVAVNNNYQPEVTLKSVSPRVSQSKAIALARSAHGDALSGQPSSELVVLGLDGVFFLAWRIVLESDGPTWETFIDAEKGVQLGESTDLNRYVNGTGQVFLANAVVATHDNTLVDNRDSASAVPSSAYTLVTLPGLLGNGNLDGEFASSSTTRKRAFDAANNFIFDRSNDEFSETMGYYYIDYAERYIQSLGFTDVNNRQQVFAVNRLKADNSFYSPSNLEISFGIGGVDDAEDAEVILHEYGHSIQDNQVPGFGSSLEGGSMGEGFGDYWAASVNAQFSGGFQDVCLAEWDATSYSSSNPPCLRRLDSTKHYPEDLHGEVHDDGEIWSAALWQIRGTIGATNSDRLVIASHFLLSPFASFDQGANALVMAGKTLGYSNRQLNQIRNILSNRGFTISV